MGQTWKQKAVRVQDAQPKWKQRATLVQSASDAQQPSDLLGGTAIAEPPAEFPKMNLGESSIYQQLQAGGMNLYGRQPLPDPPDMTMPQAAPQNTPQQQPAITPEMRAQINQFYADAQQQQQQRARAQSLDRQRAEFDRQNPFGTIGAPVQGMDEGFFTNLARGFKQTVAPFVAPFGRVGAEFAYSQDLEPPGEGAGGFVGRVAGSTLMAAPAMLNPAMATPIAAAFGAQRAGESLQEGEGAGTAIARGLAEGVPEYASNVLIPGIGKSIDQIVFEGVNRGASGARQAAMNLLAAGGIEGTEEVLTLTGDKLIDVANGKDPSIAFEEWKQQVGPTFAQGAAGGAVMAGLNVAARRAGVFQDASQGQPAAPSPAAPQPATQSGPTAQPAAGGVGENVSGAGQDTRPETTPVAPGTQVYESGPQIAPGESAARTSPAQQARQEVAIDDLSSLNYRQLVDRAKALGMKPPWGKIAELREAVRQAQTDASNRQQTDISAGQSDPSSQPSASRGSQSQSQSAQTRIQSERSTSAWGQSRSSQQSSPNDTAQKQPWEMTRDEFEISQQGETYGDWYITPDGKLGQMRGSRGMGSNRVGMVDVNGDFMGWYNRDELRLFQKSQRETSGTRAADDWLADVSSRVAKLKRDNESLLLNKSITDRFRKAVQDGRMTQEQYNAALKRGAVLSDADYARAVEVEQQITEARETPLEVKENKQHRAIVEEALREGKPVPAEVLADYPDLAAQQPAEATPPDLATLTYAQLRQRAKELGIPAKGKKAEILARVREAESQSGGASVRTLGPEAVSSGLVTGTEIESRTPQGSEQAQPSPSSESRPSAAQVQESSSPQPTAAAPEGKPPNPPTITRSAGEESPPGMTSARKVDMDRDRAALGLDTLDSPDRRSWRSVLESAQKGDVTEKANRLVVEVTQQPRALSDSETATLVLRGADLKNQHADIMRRIGKATDPAEVATLSAEANRIEAEFDSLSAALRTSGTEKGRALAAQKLTINQDFQLVSVLNRAKAAKGAELTAKQRADIEALTKRLEESDAKVRKLESRIKRLTAQRAVRKTLTNRFGGKPAPQAHIDALFTKAESLLKAGCLN